VFCGSICFRFDGTRLPIGASHHRKDVLSHLPDDSDLRSVIVQELASCPLLTYNERRPHELTTGERAVSIVEPKRVLLYDVLQ
jgi:hypothetical protein